MSLLPERFVNQVLQASDIVDVVSQYVSLTKRGKEFVGLCPFHQDHKPSMYVSPVKGIFKCFACGAGGGLFQFVMLMHKITFPEAVRQLAQCAGIPVPQEEHAGPVDHSVSTEALGKLMEFAAKFFRERLKGPEGSGALEYALKRKITDESVQRFGLGYAPEGWDNLRKAATRSGFSDHQLQAAGLTAGRDDGSSYDRFRNRLIFPIHDVTGRIIAFGGRALAADEPAKYLNSPETVLFDKSNNLYALNWAHAAISKTGRAVVVEGYMDALIPHQAGIGNVVATLGTSLTDRHVRLLARYAKEVVLVFDSDTAGRSATERAIELFLSQRLNVRVSAVPQVDGVKDPCDYVLSAGAEAMTALLDAAPDALEHAWETRRAAYLAAPDLARKRQIMEDFLRLVVSSASYGAIDAMRQSLLVGHLAELMGMPPIDVNEEMRKLSRTLKHAGRPGESGATAATSAEQHDRTERWLLSVLINEPQLFDLADERIDPTMFSPGPLRGVALRVWELGRAGKLDAASLLMASEEPAWGNLVTDLQMAARDWPSLREVLSDAVAGMLRRQHELEIQQLKTTGPATDDLLRRLSQRGALTDLRRRPRIPGIE